MAEQYTLAQLNVDLKVNLEDFQKKLEVEAKRSLQSTAEESQRFAERMADLSRKMRDLNFGTASFKELKSVFESLAKEAGLSFEEFIRVTRARIGEATPEIEAFFKKLQEGGEGKVRPGAWLEQLGEGIRSFVEHPVQSAKGALLGFIDTLGPTATGVAAIAAALGLAVKEMLAFVNEVDSAAERTENLSIRLGVTWHQTRQLQDEARIVGVEVGGLTMAARRLSAALEEPEGSGKKLARTLREMGVEGNTTGELLMNTLAALSQISNQAELTQRAYEIFGRQGLQLVPLIRAHADLSQQLHVLGYEIDENGVKKLLASNDAADKLSIAWHRLKENIAAVLSGPAGMVLDYLTNMAVAATNLAHALDAASRFPEALRAALGPLGGVVDFFPRSSKTRESEENAEANKRLAEATAAVEREEASAWAKRNEATLEGAKRKLADIEDQITRKRNDLLKGMHPAARADMEREVRDLESQKWIVQEQISRAGHAAQVAAQQQSDATMLAMQRAANDQQLALKMQTRTEWLAKLHTYIEVEMRMEMAAAEAARKQKVATGGSPIEARDVYTKAVSDARNKADAAHQKADYEQERRQHDMWEAMTKSAEKTFDTLDNITNKRREEIVAADRAMTKSEIDAVEVVTRAREDASVRELAAERDYAREMESLGRGTYEARMDAEAAYDTAMTTVRLERLKREEGYLEALKGIDVDYARKAAEIRAKIEAEEENARIRADQRNRARANRTKEDELRALQGEIAAREARGEKLGGRAEQAIALEYEIRRLRNQSRELADLWGTMVYAVDRVFDSFGQGITDAIVGTRSWGETMLNVAREFASSVINGIIKSALDPLRDSLMKVITRPPGGTGTWMDALGGASTENRAVVANTGAVVKHTAVLEADVRAQAVQTETTNVLIGAVERLITALNRTGAELDDLDSSVDGLASSMMPRSTGFWGSLLGGVASAFGLGGLTSLFQPKPQVTSTIHWENQFASGGWVPRDMLALVHAGEYVVPARDAASGMGRGGPMFSNCTFNGVTPDLVADVMNRAVKGARRVGAKI